MNTEPSSQGPFLLSTAPPERTAYSSPFSSKMGSIHMATKCKRMRAATFHVLSRHCWSYLLLHVCVGRGETPLPLLPTEVEQPRYSFSALPAARTKPQPRSRTSGVSIALHKRTSALSTCPLHHSVVKGSSRDGGGFSLLGALVSKHALCHLPLLRNRH